MAKRRVQFELLTTTMGQATSVLASLTADLAPKAVFDRPQPLTAERDVDGLTTGRGHVRFAMVADAEAFFTEVQAHWAAGPHAASILTGSRVSVHTCLHDEAISADCRSAAAGYAEAVK